MTLENYQGSKNWETWNVSLWLNNDESLYLETIEILNQEYEYEFQRADALYEFVNYLLDEKIITDKISINRVDWKEVIDGFSEVLKK